MECRLKIGGVGEILFAAFKEKRYEIFEWCGEKLKRIHKFDVADLKLQEAFAVEWDHFDVVKRDFLTFGSFLREPFFEVLDYEMWIVIL